VRRAIVRGVGIQYQRIGQGPDVVMIHGLGANLAFWYLSIARALTKNFRVTMYDLRGHGRSDMPLCGYTSADMANDLEGLLDYLGIEKAHLVGHSFGGTVALHYVVLRPERVVSLTLADVRVSALQPVQRLRDWPHWRVLQKRLTEMGVSICDDEPEAGHRLLEELAKAKCRLVRRASSSESPIVMPFGGWRGKEAAERWLQLLKVTTAREDFRAVAGLTLEKIKQVSTPTLAIFGARSRCMPTLHGLLEHLPHCKPVIVPGVGHFHPLIKPVMFVRQLLAFFAELPTQA
jgi:pimeloyl-ACP methyl ester carboxylesterase